MPGLRAEVQEGLWTGAVCVCATQRSWSGRTQSLSSVQLRLEELVRREGSGSVITRDVADLGSLSQAGVVE